MVRLLGFTPEQAFFISLLPSLRTCLALTFIYHGLLAQEPHCQVLGGELPGGHGHLLVMLVHKAHTLCLVPPNAHIVLLVHIALALGPQYALSVVLALTHMSLELILQPSASFVLLALSLLSWVLLHSAKHVMQAHISLVLGQVNASDAVLGRTSLELQDWVASNVMLVLFLLTWGLLHCAKHVMQAHISLVLGQVYAPNAVLGHSSLELQDWVASNVMLVLFLLTWGLLHCAKHVMQAHISLVLGQVYAHNAALGHTSLELQDWVASSVLLVLSHLSWGLLHGATHVLQALTLLVMGPPNACFAGQGHTPLALELLLFVHCVLQAPTPLWKQQCSVTYVRWAHT